MKKIHASELKEGMFIPYRFDVLKVFSVDSSRLELFQVELKYNPDLGGARTLQNMRFPKSGFIMVLDKDEVQDYLDLKELGR